MTKQLLGTVLLAGVFSGSLMAQEPGSIAGKVALQSTGDGIPEVAITLCGDTGRQVVSVTNGAGQLPSRDQIQEIRIPSVGEPGQISVTSATADCPNARRTTTDNTGRFVIGAVVPGLYKVHAQRNGYIGQQPLRGSPPTVVTQSVTVTDQQVVPDISISLIKGGAIAGTVRDPNGNSISSVTVQVLPANSAAPIPLVSMQSDDRGQYRLFWLPPGEFIVAVRPPGAITTTRSLPDGQTGTATWTIRQPENAPRYALTYYRNSLSTTDAKPIALREGEDVPGIDVVLLPLP